MDFYYPSEVIGHAYVVPSTGEPCTVQVNLNPPSSDLASAVVLPPNPDNAVEILVTLRRAPKNGRETATITGEWHATGQPPNNNCTAVMPNLFSIPVEVIEQKVFWKLSLLGSEPRLQLDAGRSCALQRADSPAGPWLNVGSGQQFKISTEMPSGYFQQSKGLGGLVTGSITDAGGKPLSGLSIGLMYGGASSMTGPLGGFSLPRLPAGDNLLTISNNIGASLNMVVSAALSNVVAAIQIAMEAAEVPPPPTNDCNCTPWCAIGFGTVPGGVTPVYYAGGANPPPNGGANCGDVTVTVTPPDGRSFAIRSGTAHHQNSGEEPAPGTWTVTTVVCGKTKTCSVTVP